MNRDMEFVNITKPIVSFPFGKRYSTALYRMHKYWGRKSPNVVAKYIENYCPIGGIVLDPFVGSGTTAFEAIKLGRKFIGLDINPLAVFITKTTLNPVRLTSLEAAFIKIINEAAPKILPWFKTKCPHCGQTVDFSYVVHMTEDNADDFNKELPDQVYYNCSCRGQKINFKQPDQLDKELINDSKTIEINDWCPINYELPQIRRGAGEAKKIGDLYTYRVLYSLSILYSAINKYSIGAERDCLLLAFSSSLPQCSRLAGIDKRAGHASAMGWILPSFRIMKGHVEKNPLDTFQLAYKRVYFGKIESNDLLNGYIEGNEASDIFSGKSTAMILHDSVLDLPKILHDKKIDYVFTDPPHGSALQYIKLSALSNAWLKFDGDQEQEVSQKANTIVSKSTYKDKLEAAFNSIRAVISSNVKIHVYYGGKDWLDASSAITKGSGYKLVRSIFQPQRYSFRSSFRGRSGGSQKISTPGDWILQLEESSESLSKDIDENVLENNVVSLAEEIIKKRGQPTMLKYILIPIASEIPLSLTENKPDFIQKTLEKYVGIKFKKIPIETSSRTSEKLWALIEIDNNIKTLNSRVEKAIINALTVREAIGCSRPYLYQAIYSRMPAKLTPDQSTIEKAIQKIAIEKSEGKDKKLYLKDIYLKRREKHTEVILALLRIGISNNFDIYVSPRALKRIKESDFKPDWEAIVNKNSNKILLHSALGIENSPAEYSNVLWVKDGRVRAHFEVEDEIENLENSVERGDIVRKKWPECERVLVISHKKMAAAHQILKKYQSFWHLAPHHRILTEDDPNVYQPYKKIEEFSPASAKQLKLKILSKTDIFDSEGEIVAFKLKLKCPTDVLKYVRPGHFLQIEINNETRQYFSKYHIGNSYKQLQKSPNRYQDKLEFLRIPISIHRVYYKNYEASALKKRSMNFLPLCFWSWIEQGERRFLDLLIRIIGNGTKALHSLKVGETICAIGPLGKEINFESNFNDSEFRNAILISGGVGLASLYPIAHHMRERGYNVILFAGSKDIRTLKDRDKLLPDFEEMGVQCYGADEIHDKKLVTELASEWLSSHKYTQLTGKSHIYSCGPWPMLKEVHNLAQEWSLPCTVLLDKLMLCGVGACMSCVVKIFDKNIFPMNKNKPIKMVSTCTEGPAFSSEDVCWE